MDRDEAVEPTVYDVMVEDEFWRVRQGESTIGPFRSRLDAIEFARKFARVDPPSAVVVHEADGRTWEETWPVPELGDPVSP